jgi:hypothetical protein
MSQTVEHSSCHITLLSSSISLRIALSLRSGILFPVEGNKKVCMRECISGNKKVYMWECMSLDMR